MNWYIAALKQYATFTGRASRAGYWMYVLISLAIYICLAVLDGLTESFGSSGVGLLSGLYLLATVVPGLAVQVRRLHDTNHSGWWHFIALVPLIGVIWLLVLLAKDSQPDTNQYGANPKNLAGQTEPKTI